VSGAAEADTDAAREVEPAGHFRIYLGAAPGVGKTYAMLSEGQRRRS
jgi:two-component system sensor histidine kinase KdpD